MQWTDPAFTEHAPQTTIELDQAYVKIRDAHFPRELVGEGGYINYLDVESRKASSVSRRFGANFPRLVEIKRKYDPENLFGKWFAIPRQA
jgi:FAD/FMN-containing dehydrogenase